MTGGGVSGSGSDYDLQILINSYQTNVLRCYKKGLSGIILSVGKRIILCSPGWA